MILYTLPLATFSSKLENETISNFQENYDKIYMIVYVKVVYLKGFGRLALLINIKLKELQDSQNN